MANSPYLSNQLSGPVIQAIIQGLQNAIQEPLPLIQYWTTLDILTAQDVDGTLNYVGALSGYPRPLVTNIFTSAFILILTDAALWSPSYITVNYGLSDAALWPGGPGGQLDTALPSANNYMPAVWYRQLLPIFAQIKYSGMSLSAVDLLAAWVNTNGGGTGYTITRDQYGNLAVVFTTFVDVRYLYIANQVVQAAETLPLVVFQEP